MAWGIGSLMADRTAEAIEVFQRGIDAKVMPGENPVFHFYLAGALAADEKADAARLDKALASARLAAKRSPDSARFAERVPWILARARRYDDARGEYEKLLGKFGGGARSTGLSRLADAEPPAITPLWSSSGTGGVEAESLETSLALRSARLELSNVCVSLGRLDEAQQRLEEVLDEYPDDAEANNDLGFLWADQDKHLAAGLENDSGGRRRRTGQPGLSRQPGLGLLSPRPLCRGRRRTGKGPRRKTARRHDPGPSRRRLCEGSESPDKALATWRRAAEVFEKDKEPEKAKNVKQKVKVGQR